MTEIIRETRLVAVCGHSVGSMEGHSVAIAMPCRCIVGGPLQNPKACQRFVVAITMLYFDLQVGT